jgi:serine/threonine protein kinase
MEFFTLQVSFMRSCRHPHILTFYGAGVDRESRAFLVTELMTNGSLKPLLRNHSRPLSWLTRLGFAKDIAQGMNYLHELGNIHRDLKADNCEARAPMAAFFLSFSGRLGSVSETCKVLYKHLMFVCGEVSHSRTPAPTRKCYPRFL